MFRVDPGELVTPTYSYLSSTDNNEKFVFDQLTSDVYGGTTDIVTGMPREDVVKTCLTTIGCGLFAMLMFRIGFGGPFRILKSKYPFKQYGADLVELYYAYIEFLLINTDGGGFS